MNDEIEQVPEIEPEGSAELQGMTDINGEWTDPTESELASAQAAQAEYAGEQKGGPNRNTMILLAACVIGVGLTYVFGLRQHPKEATAEEQAVEAQVDKALEKLVDPKQRTKTRQLFEDTETMVQAFYDYPAKQQVAVDDLQRNPFSRLLAEDGKATDLDDAVRRRERLILELRNKASELKLQSVLLSQKSAKCLVNGQIYSEGDRLGESFVIKTIKNNMVVLTAGGTTFEIWKD